MKIYIGTKIIKAEPMTRLEYNDYRGWEMPSNETDDDGYIVKYSDSYVSWSPKDIFESSFREITKPEIKTLINSVYGKGEV